MTRFDRATCKMVATIAERAVRDALAPHGLQVRYHGGTFAEGSFTMRIEAAVVAVDGLALTQEVQDFRQMATLYGFDSTDLGRTFNKDGHTWKLMGLKPGSKKYPVILEREDGRRFKYPVPQVLQALGRSVPEQF